MMILSTSIFVALWAAASVNAQTSASGTCLLAIDARSKYSVSRSESLAQKSVRYQRLTVGPDPKSLFYFTVQDPFTGPGVAAGLMFAVIGTMMMLVLGVKRSAAGIAKGITLPKQDEAVSACEQASKQAGKQAGKQDEALQPARPRTATVQALNGLRVIFISRVMVSHLFENYPACLFGLQLSDYYKIMPMTFFMVLSGFLRTITIKESAGFGVEASLVYVAKVIARLGPAYWLALVLMGYLSDFSPPFVAWPVQAAFLQSLMPFNMKGGVYDYFPLDGNMVGWFVSAIITCSCTFPGVFNMSLYIRTHEKKWRCAVCILTLLSLRTALVYNIRDEANFYVRSMEFFMGMLAAQVCSLLDQDIVHWLGWGWVFDGLMVVFLIAPYLHPGAWDMDAWAIIPCLAPFFWCILVAAAWAAAHHAGSQGKPSSGLLGQIVSLWPLTCLAEYSFGAYIYQFAARLILQADDRYHTCGFLWASFILSWGMAVVSEKLLEKHCRF